MLSLPIIDGQRITKARRGGPGDDDAAGWTGEAPMRVVYGEPVTHTGGDVPESVRRLGHGTAKFAPLACVRSCCTGLERK